MSTKAIPARRSRTVLRALHGISQPWFPIDTGALIAAQSWVDRIEAAGAQTGREVALAILNFDWMRGLPVTDRQEREGERFLEVLQAYAEGGPEAVRELEAKA